MNRRRCTSACDLLNTILKNFVGVEVIDLFNIYFISTPICTCIYRENVEFVKIK